MNFLFNFKFQWDTFAILWVWIAGIFQTFFFLSGVPVNLNELEEDKTYPGGLKIISLKLKPGKEDLTRMINIVDYLVNMHGLESFSPILKQDPGIVEDSLLSVNAKKKYDSRTSNWEIKSRQKLWLYTYLNLRPDDTNGSKLNLGMNMVEAFNADLLPLNEADYMLPLSISSDTLSNIINAKKLLISRVANQNKLKVIYGSEEKYIILDTLINQLDMEFKKQKLANKQALQVSRQLLSQDLEFDGLSLQILFNRINFNDNKDLLSADAYVLIKLKKNSIIPK